MPEDATTLIYTDPTHFHPDVPARALAASDFVDGKVGGYTAADLEASGLYVAVSDQPTRRGDAPPDADEPVPAPAQPVDEQAVEQPAVEVPEQEANQWQG